MFLSDPEDAYCLPDDLDKPISGQFGNPKFSAHHFRLLICKYSTTKNDCLSTEEIEKS